MMECTPYIILLLLFLRKLDMVSLRRRKYKVTLTKQGLGRNLVAVSPEKEIHKRLVTLSHPRSMTLSPATLATGVIAAHRSSDALRVFTE